MIFLILLNLISVHGREDFKNYVNLNSKIFPCVTYSNSETYFGCNCIYFYSIAKYLKSRGDLYLVRNDADLANLHKNAALYQKVVVAVNSDYFNTYFRLL